MSALCVFAIMWQLQRVCPGCVAQVWVLARVSLQMYLAALWVFNFGAVMAWMPWMYRWHLQPDADSERAR